MGRSLAWRYYMSAWRAARELPRSPPREPPDPSPRVSDIASPRSWSALESSFDASDDDGSDNDGSDEEPETLLYVAPRGRFATGGVGAVGRPAGVTRRAPPLHAYVSSLTGEPCAPLGQDDTTPRHRAPPRGSPPRTRTSIILGLDRPRSDDDGSGASSMDDDRPLHRAERAERRRAAAGSAARREARAMERERRRRHSRTVRQSRVPPAETQRLRQ